MLKSCENDLKIQAFADQRHLHHFIRFVFIYKPYHLSYISVYSYHFDFTRFKFIFVLKPYAEHFSYP